MSEHITSYQPKITGLEFYQPDMVSNIGFQHLHQSLEFASEVVSVRKCP